MSTRRSAPRFVRGWKAAALGIGAVAGGASGAYMVLFAIGVAVEGNPVHSPWSEARRDIMGALWAAAAVTTTAFVAAMWWAWRRDRDKEERDFVVTRDPGPGRVIR